MELNRHNYESYFLLYIDGELDAASQRKVEQFVTEHPDLAQELDALKETILQPEEDLVMSSRTSLYKNDPTFETMMLLHHDQELLSEDMPVLRSYLENDPTATDHAWMASARFAADTTIVFPDKKSLYRSERRSPRIIYFMFRAAAILLLVWSAWWWMGSNDPMPLPTDSGSAKPIMDKSLPVPTPTATAAATVRREKQDHPVSIVHSVAHTNDANVPSIQRLLVEENASGSIALIEPSHQKPVQESNNLPTPITSSSLESDNATVATQIATQWREAEMPSSDFPDEVQILNTRYRNRTKIRTILRTVSRVMERTTGYRITSSDDPRAIRVANFAVAPSEQR